LISTLGLLTSCVDEPEAPEIQVDENSQLMKVKTWFEENKTTLRLPERGSNFRTDAEELILPFFEKEPDWDKFHHYYFPDGREVFEISIENAERYFPKSLIDSFPNQDVSEIMIQNIMFVKNPDENRFDPLIARYYPNDELSIRTFDAISYNAINEFWSGRLEIFTYDEHHFISFMIDEGTIKSTSKYGSSNIQNNTRITGDCQTTIRYVVYYTPIGGTFGMEVNHATIAETFCTGAGTGNTGTGNNGNANDPYNDGQYYYDGTSYTSNGDNTYSPPPVPAPQFIINNIDNECAEEIFKQLAKGSSRLGEMSAFGSLDIFPWMLDLFKQGGKFKYRIEDTNLVGANATTLPINSQGVIVIQLDNSYLNSATSLSIARTIIHETAHAYMRAISKTDHNFAIELNNYYQNHDKNEPEAHHGMMSQYLLGMAVSLYNWDKYWGATNGSLDFQYYYTMAFAGMFEDGTNNPILEVVPMIPNGDWAAVLDILGNEQDGTASALGMVLESCNN